ncbi:MAG: hypothetical protein HY302_13335 [Opitutae bacterium]|nr:hypothetical protein [Opitutae bacterium]
MKSFLQGRPAAPAPALRDHGAAPETGFSAVCATPAHGTHEHDGATATVECVKQGSKVTRLIVTCACGSRIEVECLYPGD